MEAEDNIKTYTFKETMSILLGTILGLTGFFLLIFYYKGNSANYADMNLIKSILTFNAESIYNNFELMYLMTEKFFMDIREFAIQTSNYINSVGFTFLNFLNIYKVFASNFGSLLPMILIYGGLYIKQQEGTPFFKIFKVFTGSILIFGTAFLMSIALSN